jgi:hypothetical protein
MRRPVHLRTLFSQSGLQETITHGTLAATPADLFALFDRLSIEHSEPSTVLHGGEGPDLPR